MAKWKLGTFIAVSGLMAAGLGFTVFMLFTASLDWQFGFWVGVNGAIICNGLRSRGFRLLAKGAIDEWRYLRRRFTS